VPLLAGYASDLPYGVRPLEDALCRSWIKSFRVNHLLTSLTMKLRDFRHKPDTVLGPTTSFGQGSAFPKDPPHPAAGSLVDPADVTDQLVEVRPARWLAPPFVQT
jgi:hypothetical protein